MEDLKLSIKNKIVDIEAIVDKFLEKATDREEKLDLLAIKLGAQQAIKELEVETNIVALKFTDEYMSGLKKDMKELLDII